MKGPLQLNEINSLSLSWVGGVVDVCFSLRSIGAAAPITHKQNQSTTTNKALRSSLQSISISFQFNQLHED